MVRFLADFSRQKGGFYNRREGVYPPAKSPNTGWHDMGRKNTFFGEFYFFLWEADCFALKKIYTHLMAVCSLAALPTSSSKLGTPACKKWERRKINTNTYVKTPQKKKD